MVVMVCRHGYAQDEIQGAVLTVDQKYALALINEIREAPLVYAASIGYDRDRLVQELPWLANILNSGLPLCSSLDSLNRLAEQRNSFTQQSVTPVEEIGATGEGEPAETSPDLDFAVTGEMGGIVSFYNFMPAVFAWEIIIRNRFIQELNPDFTGPLCILNPRFDAMGVAMRGGVHGVDGEVKNAYFATLCFASSLLKSEAQVLNMVNQVRYRPMDSIEPYLGMSLFEGLGCNPESLSNWYWIYPPLWDESRLPPLFESSILRESSGSRITGVLTPDATFLQASSLEETEPTLSLDEVCEGVEASMAQAVVFVDVTSDLLAETLFAAILGAELRDVSRPGAIFSTGTNEGGVGIALAPGNDRIQPAGVVVHARAACVDGGSGGDDLSPADGQEYTATKQSGVYGVVFFDANKNGIYTPGEGKELVSVDIFRQLDNTLVCRTFTDASGHFSVKLERDQEYRFELCAGQQSLAPFYRLLDRDLFLPVDFSLEYP